MQAIRPSNEEQVDREIIEYAGNPAGEQTLLSGKEAVQTDQAVPMVPVAKSSGHESDHCPSPIHDGNQEHHHKKSVLAKVKEKAKKWKSLLTKKKHEGSSMPTTPSNTDEDDESVGHDPEYYGAPMYESETAPKMYKERSSKIQPAVPSPKTHQPVLDHGPSVPAHEPISALEADRITSQQHCNGPFCALAAPTSGSPTIHAPVVAPAASLQRNVHDTEKESRHAHDSSKTLTETVTEMLAPAYNMVSEATNRIAAKIQSPVAKDEIGAKIMWDKGVSMKEYLLQKLEPGEEEKALSQVITEVISPKKAEPRLDADKGVVEKVKGAVSALLGMDGEETGVHQTSSRPLFNNTEGSPILTGSTASDQCDSGILIPDSPLPLSVHPLVAPAPTNTSLADDSMNASTTQNSTIAFEEVEEPNQRRPQAYTN